MPLHGRECQRPNGDLIQFPNGNLEGVYNAAIALLNYDIERQPSQYGKGRPRFLAQQEEPGFRAEDWYYGSPSLPKLIDYAGPPGPACPVTGEPAVWISVVGDGQIVPSEPIAVSKINFGPASNWEDRMRSGRDSRGLEHDPGRSLGNHHPRRTWFRCRHRP